MKRDRAARRSGAPPGPELGPGSGTHEHPRERIHGAALVLFARYGLEGVSLQRIADEVGLHKSSLFHHYRSKSELAMEVFTGALERVVSRLGPLEGDDPPRLDTLVDVVLILSDHFADHPAEARLILAMLTAPPDGELRSIDGDARPVEALYRIVGGWLDRARRSGAIRRANLRQTLVNLMGLVLFYPAAAEELPEVTGPEPFSPKARAVRRDELSTLLRGALAP